MKTFKVRSLRAKDLRRQLGKSGYGNQLLKTGKSFKLVGKYDFNCGVGIVGI